MQEIIFVLGGCKSGKTSFALKLAEGYKEYKKIYLATSIVCDEEMKERVERHRKERGDAWQTVEYPYKLCDGLIFNMKNDSVIVVDCLTMWVNNLMYKKCSLEEISKQINTLIKVLTNAKGVVILISNEVGFGIVPSEPISRRFRDVVGILHQEVAKVSHKVYFMISGIPTLIKGSGNV